MDISTPGIQHALNSIAATEHVDAEAVESSESTEHGLLVKVNPAIHVRVVPLDTTITTTIPSSYPAASTPPRSTSEMVESFMSSWSRLVGDPVLSKWIVMVLAVSISLNGYLLKGIAAGLGGKGSAKLGGVRFGGDAPPEEAVVHAHSEPVLVQQPVVPHIPAAPVATAAVPRRPAVFTLDEVDRRLKARRLTETSPLASSSSSSDSDENMESTEVRSLEECINIYDNGPRPVSVALSMLNDEEVILLAQNGKIAAYALEKVLGNTEYERAVRIRRCLICELFHSLSVYCD